LFACEDRRIQPKILDFGIAKLTDPRDVASRLTEAGTVVGSPDYMSPEQARGRDDVDYRTDIWSLCVVLYEAVTGNAPFSASNYNALLRAIVEDEPRSLPDHAAGDAELWTVLKKGLAKDPAHRHRSMAELGRALAIWLLGHGIQADACGTAVDSKWLGRSSDPLSLGDEAVVASPRTLNLGFDPKPTHDSRAGTDAVDSRGPFTATIRPGSIRRLRKLRAAGAVAAALAALAVASVFALRQSSDAGPSHAAITRRESPRPPGPVELMRRRRRR